LPPTNIIVKFPKIEIRKTPRKIPQRPNRVPSNQFTIFTIISPKFLSKDAKTIINIMNRDMKIIEPNRSLSFVNQCQKRFKGGLSSTTSKSRVTLLSDRSMSELVFLVSISSFNDMPIISCKVNRDRLLY